MTTPNPERSVEEIVEEFRNRDYIEENGKLYVEVDAHWLTQTLQAERQKCEEARESGYHVGCAQCMADNNILPKFTDSQP